MDKKNYLYQYMIENIETSDFLLNEVISKD